MTAAWLCHTGLLLTADVKGGGRHTRLRGAEPQVLVEEERQPEQQRVAHLTTRRTATHNRPHTMARHTGNSGWLTKRKTGLLGRQCECVVVR